MREAVKPTLDAMLSFIPVGEPVKPHHKYRWGEGGGLRRDARIKIVKDIQYESKALVGIRGGKDKAGWRAHFTEYGPTNGGKHTRRFGKTRGKTWTRTWKATPFASKAEQLTKELVKQRITTGLELQLEKDFKEFQ